MESDAGEDLQVDAADALLVYFVARVLHDADAAEVAPDECGDEAQVERAQWAWFACVEEQLPVVEDGGVGERAIQGWCNSLVQLESCELN
jgi:hypothetical protein